MDDVLDKIAEILDRAGIPMDADGVALTLIDRVEIAVIPKYSLETLCTGTERF